MTEHEIGRLLALYYGLASALELLHKYCEKRLAIDVKKQFHNPTEKYCYNNLISSINKSNYWYERYMKESYKIEAIKLDDDGEKEIGHYTEFEQMDESIKTGIGYARFLIIFYNIVANCNIKNMKQYLMKFESTCKLFIKKWYLPKETLDDFQHYE